MTTKSELKALSQALKLEKQGRAFYLKAVDETLDPEGQAMFRSLADDERMHVEMVERQLHALEGDGAYVLLPDLKPRPSIWALSCSRPSASRWPPRWGPTPVYSMRSTWPWRPRSRAMTFTARRPARPEMRPERACISGWRQPR
jgi:hypothetical protein